MYVEIAVKRIKNISWSEIGKNGTKEDIDLAFEFVRRMAVFCKQNNLNPTLPFMINIAELLGDQKKDDSFLRQFNFKEEVIGFLNKPDFSTMVVKFYLQLLNMADNVVNNNAHKYLNVYEPIIRMFERGGSFVYRERGMSVINSGLIPMSNWCEIFFNKEPIDIKDL